MCCSQGRQAIKVNCWEFKRCGKGPEDTNSGGTEQCPVAVNEKLNGINNGTRAGRVCWAVAGTSCDGQVQKDFEEKYVSCKKCDFYKLVRKEESAGMFEPAYY